MRTQRAPTHHAAEPDVDRTEQTRVEGVPSGGYQAGDRDYMGRDYQDRDYQDRDHPDRDRPDRDRQDYQDRDYQDRDYRGRGYAGADRDRYGPAAGPAALSPAAAVSRGIAASAPSALVLLAGVWLIVSRFVFSYPAAGSAPGGVLNGVVIGVIVALTAMFRLSNPDSSPMLSAASLVLGGWMIASPWVFGYNHLGAGSRPFWSDLITGAAIVLAALASWSAGTARTMRMAQPAH